MNCRNTLGSKPNPSIPITFERFSLKFLKIARLLGKIKSIVLKELSFLHVFPRCESFAWQTFTSLSLFTWLVVFVRTYCVPITILNQNKRSRLLYLLLHIKFYVKPVSLINKLQPLSYQSTSNIIPRLPLHVYQPAPKIYNANVLLTRS